MEIRIKKDIVYNSTKGILVSFFDISKNFESLYYKNMNQFKGRLIRSISHELRTRLNMIQGIIEILISDAKKH